MSIMNKLKQQHEKSVEQMKQSSKDFKKSTGEVKGEFQRAYEETRERFDNCPKCNSSDVLRYKGYNMMMFIIGILIMIVGTIFLGFVGLIIGSLFTIFPSLKMITSTLTPKVQCKSCNHIWKK